MDNQNNNDNQADYQSDQKFDTVTGQPLNANYGMPPQYPQNNNLGDPQGQYGQPQNYTVPPIQQPYQQQSQQQPQQQNNINAVPPVVLGGIGLGTAIIGSAFLLWPLVTLIFSLVGLGLAIPALILGLGNNKKAVKFSHNKGLSIAAIVVGSVAIAVSAIMLILGISFLAAFGACGLL